MPASSRNAKTGRTLYLLDEPTTGLHFDDVRRLLDVLHRLTDLGNTVIIIEHNLDIIRNADYLIDMGPEGGEGGGRMVGHGTPEQLATVEGSFTGDFLRTHFTGVHVSPSSKFSGSQGTDIKAQVDKAKDERAKFVPAEKKTGVPTAKSAAAKTSAAKKAPAKKTAARAGKA